MTFFLFEQISCLILNKRKINFWYILYVNYNLTQNYIFLFKISLFFPSPSFTKTVMHLALPYCSLYLNSLQNKRGNKAKGMNACAALLPKLRPLRIMRMKNQISKPHDSTPCYSGLTLVLSGI